MWGGGGDLSLWFLGSQGSGGSCSVLPVYLQGSLQDAASDGPRGSQGLPLQVTRRAELCILRQEAQAPVDESCL